MTLKEHVEKEIKALKRKTHEGSNRNRNHLDGYTLKGYKDKLLLLEEFLSKLKYL